jgi:hypothetical protein
MIQESDILFLDLEKNLKSGLSPITPDPGFIQRLQQRLRTEKKVVLEPASFPIMPVIVGLGLILGLGILLIYKGTDKKG